MANTNLPKQEVDFNDLRRELANEFNTLVYAIRNQDCDTELAHRLGNLRVKILFICGLEVEGFFTHVVDDHFHLAGVEDI